MIDEILDLFIELEANEDQLEFPVVYASGRDGLAYLDSADEPHDLSVLFDTIIKYVPAPKGEVEEPLQLLISSLDFDEYVGTIAIGRIERGKITKGQKVVVCRKDGSTEQVKVGTLQIFTGLKRTDVEQAQAGEIVCLTGAEDITIGETICDLEYPEPLPFIDLDEPTISMQFVVNNSPFAGKEGVYVTSRHLRSRLFKEKETNLSLKVNKRIPG